MSAGGGKVIALFARDGSQSEKGDEFPSYDRECYPRCALVLDGAERKATCSKCGKVYDAWAALRHVIHAREWRMRDVEALDRKRRMLADEVARLQETGQRTMFGDDQ